MQEVSKEVVLVDSVLPTEEGVANGPMQVDNGSTTEVVMSPAAAESTSGAQVLKVIKKLEVQVLCNQHNPVSEILDVFYICWGLHIDECVFFRLSGCGSSEESH